MELWQEIMCKLFQQREINIVIPQITDINKIFEMECYKALEKISKIIKNRDLDDKECFMPQWARTNKVLGGKYPVYLQKLTWQY